MRPHVLASSTLLVSVALVPLVAQQAGDDAVTTLRVQSRLVIEDVLVMDAKGNPVHGLPASAFHIFDNGKPQTLRDFDEGSPKPTQQTESVSLPAGTFSNAVAGGPAATTEVLLIDTDDMLLVDQMYLLQQLKKAIVAMPSDLPASIFVVRAGRAVPVLLNTTDRGAMLRAADEILPVQNHAIDSRFQSAMNQLMSAAAYLQQTPGRKNLLWFAGEFPLVSAGAGEVGGQRANYSARENAIHQVQEALSEARISVYPVDVRGVIESGIPQPTADNSLGAGGAGGRDPRAMNAASQKKEVAAPPPSSDADRRGEMRSLAAATGGRAYMLNNIAAEIDNAFDLGKSAYTLAYMPAAYSTDQSFHRVTVKVDGNYTVSYRNGYLATWTGSPESEPRERLVAGTRQRVDPNQSKPLLFQAHLVPQTDPQHIVVSFTIPVSQLAMQASNGSYSNTLTVSSYAYDASGRVKDGKMQELSTLLNSAQYEQARRADKKVATKQELTVPKGAKYLMLLVRDKQSQRVGSLLLQTRILESLPRQGTASEASSPSARATGPSAFEPQQEQAR